MKQPCVYLMASRKDGTLYCGVTSDLIKRVWEHKNNVVPGFTQRYGVHTLVWYELHDAMVTAIAREKAIKEWKRHWKMELIGKANPQWRDLYPEILGGASVSATSESNCSDLEVLPEAGNVVRATDLDPGFRRGDE